MIKFIKQFFNKKGGMNYKHKKIGKVISSKDYLKLDENERYNYRLTNEAPPLKIKKKIN